MQLGHSRIVHVLLSHIVHVLTHFMTVELIFPDLSLNTVLSFCWDTAGHCYFSVNK